MFSIDLNRIVQLVLLSFGLSASGCMLTGCQSTQRGTGEVYFEFGTKIALGLDTKRNEAGEDEVSYQFESRALEERIAPGIVDQSVEPGEPIDVTTSGINT